MDKLPACIQYHYPGKSILPNKPLCEMKHMSELPSYLQYDMTENDLKRVSYAKLHKISKYLKRGDPLTERIYLAINKDL